MIYRDEFTTEEWIEKHPRLRIMTGSCDGCGKKLKTTRPFMSNGYAGLKAPDCCERQRHSCMTMVTTNEKSFAKWNEILNG